MPILPVSRSHTVAIGSRLGAVAAVAAGSLLGLGGVAAATPSGVHYVALGDSYAAGSVDLPQTDLLTCARSAINYPSLVAQALGAASFRDVTCGSATVDNLYSTQPGNVIGSAPPQLDAVTPDTTLVTMTMGGNDIGLASASYGCFDPTPAAAGFSCADRFTGGGTDVFATRIAALEPVLGNAVEQIRVRAPQARILLVGYPTVFREGGCPATQPITARDGDYIQSTLTELNGLIRTVAAAHGADFVDVAASSVGHDACAAPADQWVNGFIPTLATPAFAPVHPTVPGLRNMADQVLATLN